MYIIKNMIVLSGASASGKTEVAKMLAKKYGIVKVITTTTRCKRCGEVDGKDYFFVNQNEFEKMIKQNEFVEYTIYNDFYYGSTKKQISDGKCLVIDPIGLKAYINLKQKNIITFFLDSLEETRFKRMLSRGDDIKKAESRIAHDRIAFKQENIPTVNFHIDSETKTIEEVADEIYFLYKNSIK